MKICINGRFLSQATTGVQRYALQMLTALDKLLARNPASSEDEFILLLPRNANIVHSLQRISVKRVGLLTGHLWEQIELPFYAMRARLICFCNSAPILKKSQVLTIHDASVCRVPMAYSVSYRLFYRNLYRVLKRSDAVFCTDSEFSKMDLQTYFNLSEKCIRVVACGREHISELIPDNDILKRGNMQGNYVLVVANFNQNKNLPALNKLVQELQKLNTSIVLVGEQNSRIYQNSHLSPEPNLVLLGRVSDRELKSLYSHAVCLVHPALNEGFGLPPLEAMACGCPVVVSDRASLPEVCGEAAAYFDPDSEDDIAETVLKVCSSEELRSTMKLNGLRRAEMFSWEKSAAIHLKIVKGK